MNARQNTIIVYGSYGYTGKLIVEECKSRGLHVILAGRRNVPLESQSKETGYPFEIADMNDSIALQGLLEKGKLVIHCAGPFQDTARRMVEMCLSTQSHYTDISGEYQVFEMLQGYDSEGKRAGITILPGTGFDVVPSDCMALHLQKQLPAARRLELAFTSPGGGLSRGTAKTMVQGLGYGSVVRKSGKLVHIPLGEKIKEIDFGSGKFTCVNIPWGDVSTAWFSTGIPDIEVYTPASPALIAASKASRYFNWLLKSRWLKNILSSIIDQRTAGPDREKINSSKSFLWGKVYDDSGKTSSALIETLSGYDLTSKTSVLIAQKILSGNFKTGFQTPASAFGADLILEIENTRRRKTFEPDIL
jgi:short subunit dehydrogenase-like uncharacterized protein